MSEEILLLEKKIDEQKLVIDQVYTSLEKIRKYFLISAWVTIIALVLPLVGIMFIAPTFLSGYTNTLQGGE
jgi:hypothetical protein